MADSKLTALTETTSPATTDDVYVVTTPGGTPASKRCTIANLKTAMAVMSLLGSASDGSTRTYTANNTWEDIVNATVTFTAAASENVIVDLDIVWRFASANWGHCEVQLLLDGATTGVTPVAYKLYAQDSNPDTTIYRQNHVRFVVATGSSGSHTVKVQTRDENSSVDREVTYTLLTAVGV